MTTRVTISVPDEVAARAAASGNASRYFTEAALAQIARERDREWMAAHGIPYTEGGVPRAGATLGQARLRMVPGAWAAARQGPAAYAAYLATQADPPTAATRPAS